ncbi:MAG: DIP1984 family protein [Ignavibacteria bacterium]|nr:DIP1984 family protein [Ignavibacteria bacterium]
MKLAEGLLQRASAQARMARLQKQLVQKAMGRSYDEQIKIPQKLLKDIEATSTNLDLLIRRIKATKMQVRMQGGGTLADALLQREQLRLRYASCRTMAKAAVMRGDCYSRSEVRFTNAVSVSDMYREVKVLAKELQDLAARMHAVSCITDLVEG